MVFSSVASYEGTKGLLFYASAKSAIQTAVRTIAKAIGHRGQRINSISPAWVETEMTDSYLETVGEKKENVRELQTVKSNIEQILRREPERRKGKDHER